MGSCESLISRKSPHGGNKEQVPCGQLGIRYRVRLPTQTGEVSFGKDAIGKVGRAASATVECVLCPKHRRAALDEGKELWPI
jgi:hypothetical protein